MRKKIALIAACATLAVLATLATLAAVLGGAVAGTRAAAGTPRMAQAVESHIDSSYANVYGSLADTKAGATDVVVAKVIQVTHRTDYPGYSGAPVTISTARVERALKGGSSGDLTVLQLGGVNANGTLAVNDTDPELQPGERAVLFLFTRTKEHYTLLNGGASHFQISPQGIVKQMHAWLGASASWSNGGEPPANAAKPETPTPIAGLTEAAFIAQVLAA